MKTRHVLSLMLLIILSITTVKAQIVYSDIPDTNINYPIIEYLGNETVYYYLDMNNDSINDFFFRLKKWQEWITPHAQPIRLTSEIKIIGDNRIYSNENEDPSEDCAKVLLNNDTINSNCKWNKLGFIYIDVHPYDILNCNVPFQNKYYGLSFYIGYAKHYGWLQLDINEFGEILLKDYAYNTIPDQLITAGQIEPNLISISPNENQVIITNTSKGVLIKLKETNELIRIVRIYNLSGTTIFEHKIDDSQAAINLCNINSGFYITRVVTDNYIYSKLLYIN